MPEAIIIWLPLGGVIMEDQDQRECPSCGNVLEEGELECSSCGESLIDDDEVL